MFFIFKKISIKKKSHIKHDIFLEIAIFF